MTDKQSENMLHAISTILVLENQIFFKEEITEDELKKEAEKIYENYYRKAAYFKPEYQLTFEEKLYANMMRALSVIIVLEKKREKMPEKELRKKADEVCKKYICSSLAETAEELIKMFDNKVEETK
jgi:hypothetical protein